MMGDTTVFITLLKMAGHFFRLYQRWGGGEGKALALLFSSATLQKCNVRVMVRVMVRLRLRLGLVLVLGLRRRRLTDILLTRPMDNSFDDVLSIFQSLHILWELKTRMSNQITQHKSNGEEVTENIFFDSGFGPTVSTAHYIRTSAWFCPLLWWCRAS